MTRESKKRADKTRILASLKGAGGRGITQKDWDGPNTPDGGEAIDQIARRILDLRQDGHKIETRKDPRNKRRARYVLVIERWERITPPEGRPALAVVEPAPEPDRLFTPPPSNAIRGEAA